MYKLNNEAAFFKEALLAVVKYVEGHSVTKEFMQYFIGRG